MEKLYSIQEVSTILGMSKDTLYVEENLHEPLTLENIAAQSNFSKYHFHRIFQSTVGMTV
ncbi:AraC family transcriptional regulator [Viridibacillus arvi]|uniref:AraC family transcriptional regulator n=1 Tax=Viridibacillus arvi TaxID=263475 RepID=UPI00389AC171